MCIHISIYLSLFIYIYIYIHTYTYIHIVDNRCCKRETAPVLQTVGDLRREGRADLASPTVGFHKFMLYTHYIITYIYIYT